MATLGMLGALSVVASDAPAWLAWALAPASIVAGAWLAHRELRRPRLPCVWTPAGGLSIDGRRVQDASLAWRGRLAFLEWRDHAGRRRRVSWWPDTLGSAGRRELRLAAIAAPTSRGAPSMAP
jgi:toxin CptA